MPHAQQLLARAAETVESARAIGRGVFECLELGITPVAALSFFPNAARHFAAAHPGVALALTEALSDDLEKAVAQKRLDLAIVHLPSSRDDLVVKESPESGSSRCCPRLITWPKPSASMRPICAWKC